MLKNRENVIQAVKVLGELLAGNEVSSESNRELYNLYVTDSNVEDFLYLICEELSLKLYNYEDELFLSPGVENKVFGYNNDDFKKRMKYNFDNMDMYMSYFVMMTIITMFYKESDYDTHIRRISINNILEKVNEKMNALLSIDEISEVSSDLSYNFEEISKRWKSLRKISIRGSDFDNLEASDRGKNSQYAFINTVCNFLEREGLIRIDANMNSILPQKRFKAIVYSYFQNKDSRNEVYDYIKKLSEKEDTL